jgi:single-strand DNA-binding protein
MSLNKVCLIGRLGHDPRRLVDKQGVPYATEAGLATSTKWIDKTTGEKKEEIEWHNLLFYNKIAEIAAEYLKKGSLVHIEGKIKSNKYKDKNGVDKTSYKIIVQSMTMLSSKKDNNTEQNNVHKTQENQSTNDFQDDEIPF